MKKTILDLWNGRIEPCREPAARSEEVAQLVRFLDRHWLSELLNEEGKETLQKYSGCYDELEHIAVEEAFVRGFSYGVRLVAEGMADANWSCLGVLKAEK